MIPPTGPWTNFRAAAAKRGSGGGGAPRGEDQGFLDAVVTVTSAEAETAAARETCAGEVGHLVLVDAFTITCLLST